jgi:uncharacterized surface protein with fasciclin (FAS1) repeats
MKRFTLFLLLASLFLGACNNAGNTGENTEEESTEEEMAAEENMTETEAPDIVALASDTESLSTLVAAVQAADLVETLQGDGPFTVFAPTNAAFDALPEGTLDNLLKPENKDQLTAILTYHVVPAEVRSGDLSDGMTAATVNGAEITVSLDGGVMINDANVTTADVEASNGVVHIIDKVILPPSE